MLTETSVQGEVRVASSLFITGWDCLPYWVGGREGGGSNLLAPVLLSPKGGKVLLKPGTVEWNKHSNQNLLNKISGASGGHVGATGETAVTLPSLF